MQRIEGPIPREVEYTTTFRRDYKREKKGRHRSTLDAELMDAVRLLAGDLPMPPRYVDHPLKGEWKDHRDCHIRPDLVLIYRKPPGLPPVLQLVRLGSHSELSL